VIDISVGVAEAVAPPPTGSSATEMAINAAKIARAKAMDGLSGDYGWRVNGAHEALM
jgi:hypothetical protein